jgi:cbb3-type cytochrome oxidase maturation protein
MSVLYVALPVALLLAIIAVIAFVVQVRSGQFDDLETPPRRMLFDDVEIDPQSQNKTKKTDEIARKP